MRTLDLPSLSQGLLAAAPDPIVIVDEHGEIVLVNDRAIRVFGFEAAELLGQRVEILMVSQTPQRSVQRIRVVSDFIAETFQTYRKLIEGS
jgi:PAS domain S-box-containing protein